MDKNSIHHKISQLLDEITPYESKEQILAYQLGFLIEHISNEAYNDNKALYSLLTRINAVKSKRNADKES